MGTSIAGHLSPAEVAQAQAIGSSMAALGNLSGGPARGFVFFAAFDGTNNDRTNLPLSGSPYPTNVANLYDQAVDASKTNPNLEARYYPGVGTGGQNGTLVNAAVSPTPAIHYAAEQALAHFAEQASKYLQGNPDATYADLSASAVGFSRGSATAVVFAQLLNERGLVLPDGTVVAPPGVAVIGLGLI
ncbi:MAG: hypothetical protein EOO23_04685, partial [Comamonadaceae bacterium]